MSGNFAKDPLNASHGDSLVGQNFQSLKSKEVRDSVSPTRDLKFHSMTLNHPNTTGWDVQTSSEVSPDGRAYRTETTATTDGVEKINGGTAEFRGRNDQRASASHQGDDKNFVKKASDSSNTHLQERVVIGDENSGRTEMKSSSTTTSSSSQVTSSSTVEYGGGEPVDAKYLMDNTNRHQFHDKQRLTQEQYVQQQQQQHQQRQQQLQQQEFEQIKRHQQQQQSVQQQQQEQRQYTEELNRNRQESSTSRNVETQQTTEQSRRIVDMDKASPEYQQHVQQLMAEPGEIISNTVEYPKPNVKMITTVKRLPDGTIVKNKRYETEELQPTVDTQRQRTTSTTSQSSTQHRNEQQRRQQTEDNVYNRQQNVRTNTHSNNQTPRRSEHDVVDNAEPFTRAPHQQQVVESHPNERFTDEVSNVETKFSSVQKSSRRFSTETTSETVEEFSDQTPTSHTPGIRGKPSSGRTPTQDFSTHGFPSVKPNKPTQEYANERPHGAPQSQAPDFSTQGFPSVRPNKPTQQYPSDRPRPADVEHITQRIVTDSNTVSPHGFPAVRPNTNVTTTKDGDVIIVSSESTRSSKFNTNAERTIETEVVIDGDSAPRPQEYPSRGFPAVNESSPGGRDSPRYGTPTREYLSSPRRPQPADDFSTHGFPSARDVAKPNSSQPVQSRTINKDGSVTVVNSETKKTVKQNTNREHIIETEIVGDNEHYSPSGIRQPDKITFPPTPQPGERSTHGFPSVRDSAPTNDYPSGPRKPQPSEDFSTHGFPSVKDSAPVRGGTPSRDYPSSPRHHQPTEDFSTHGFPSVRTPNKHVLDYSTPSGGYPSTKDTNAPRLTPTQPSKPQPSTASTRKTTTTTDSASQRLISKERDVDATHRAFAASLRCSSPVDSIDHHRTTPRSSVSSTRTFRRDGREGSHDSETSRISSGTVTRSSPSKSVGKTVVTKQTVVKTRNVNGSNETIDLTPQRHTKSPSPNKSVITTTTRTTTTRKSPGEVPKPEKSSYSPAPSNHIHRTHPKATSQVVRDDVADANHDEPIHNQPLSSSIIEPKQRNRSPSGPKSSSPQTICQPNKREPSVERRTVVRESSFENNDWQNTILDSSEKEYPVKGDYPKHTEKQPTNDKSLIDEHIETIYIKETPIDTSDYPGKKVEPAKRPDKSDQIKNKTTEFVTVKTTRTDKKYTNDDNDVIDEQVTKKPRRKEPSEPVNKKPISTKPLDSNLEPHNRKPNEKHAAAPLGKYPGNKKPVGPATSPTRKPTDNNTSKISSTSTTIKTTRKDNIYITGDENQPKQPVTKKPTDNHSPTRKHTDKNIVTTLTVETTRKNKPYSADLINQPDEPTGRKAKDQSPTVPGYKQPTNKRASVPELSPTRKTISKTVTTETTSKDKPHSIEEDQQPNEPVDVKSTNLKPEFVRKNHSPTRTTSDTNKVKTSTITTTITKTRNDKTSPSIISKPTDTTTSEFIHKKTITGNPLEPLEKQLKDTNPTSTGDRKPTQFEQSDDELIPTSRIPAGKPISKQPASNETKMSKDIRNTKTNHTTKTVETITDKNYRPKPKGRNPSQPEDSDNDEIEDEHYSSTVATTTTKRVNANEPQSVHPKITNETRRVEELFNTTDNRKILKNVNEEFITFERQVRDRPEKEPSKPLQKDDTKLPNKKPLEPTTVENVTKTYEEIKNIEYEERKPSKLVSKEPKSKPIAKPIEPELEDDDDETFTNTLKTSVVTTTIKTGGQDKPSSPDYLSKPYEPKSREPSDKKPVQPNDKKPKVLQPSDDQALQEVLNTTTTITTNKVIHKETPITDDREPSYKKPLKPHDERTSPLGHDYRENSRSPTREPGDGKTFKTTTTTTITETIAGETPNTGDESTSRIPTLDEKKRVEELFKITNTTKSTKNYNEEFIDVESQNNESPDGVLMSKAPAPEPSSPSFKKKGVSPRETFEDRCRQILGMENYGDTPGTYKNKPDDQPNGKPKEIEHSPEIITTFDVKIEDCEDDEPNYLNNIKEALKPQNQKPTTTSKFEKPKRNTTDDVSDEELIEEVECLRKETVVPFKKSSPEKEVYTEITRKTAVLSETDINTETDEQIVANTTKTKPVKKTSIPKPRGKKLEDMELVDASLSESETPERETDEESQPDSVVTERELQHTDEEHTSLIVNTQKKQPLKSDKKPTSIHSSPSSSPTRKASEPVNPRKTSPVREYGTRTTKVTTTKTVESKPKTLQTYKSPEKSEKHCVVKKDRPTSPTKTRAERVQKLDSPTIPDKQNKKPSKESPTPTIKDRLRSATRNKKPSDTESDSSPEMSPTRFTERRRSSNISVHTEIIIDHSGPQSPKSTEKTPEKQKPQTKKTTPLDTTSPTKPFRRFPVTERKESAPVPSVSRKDKDVKMARSISEKVIKVTEKPVKKPNVPSLSPNASPKGERRPNKCFTTKTINLTTNDKLINSGEMENIIIDIQHAKSSREPSPDKIVPTPVPVHLDTGKPRYPDVVQEPEDEPCKKPIIKNIPIFEEESNEFVNCHITEIKTDKISKLVDLEEDYILDNPTIEAPKSLDYPSIDRPDDDCLLSVHEKVSKFTHTAEEIKKPKASSPFSREFDKTPKVPENDECLLTVDEKVSKFIKTAEAVTKPSTPVREVERPSYTDLDEELQKDDCTLTVSQKVNKFLSTAEKLAPTVPQRSPELVAKIERTISKQSEPEYLEDVSDEELTPFSQNHTVEIEKRRQKDILSRPTVFDNITKTDRYTDYTDEEVTTVRSTTRVPESDEVIPHTRDHTTKLELKRQKDILSRPSIYDKNAKVRPQSPNKKEPVGSFKSQQTVSNRTKQTEYTLKKITPEENEKTRERKPSTLKPESRKSPTKLQTSTVAVTRTRFEVSDNKKLAPKSPVEPKTSRVPSTTTTPRKQTIESKTTTTRKYSSEPDTKISTPSTRKPSNEAEHKSPLRRARKPSTEPDSHYPGRKPSTESAISLHDFETIESESEFSSTTRRRSSSKTKDYLETVQTEIERFSPNQKSPSQEKPKPQTFSHSPTRKDATSTTKVTKVTKRTIQHSSPSDCSDIEIVENILDRSTEVKAPTPTSTIGRTRPVADTVAARRNIFENGGTPKGSNSPSPVGRRPSYMDHTVSSLEHTRRDSLEVNKHNYSRKSSVESEVNYERRPNAAVKFDVPHKPQHTDSIPEDIDIESIFELEVLERLLETETSYDLRRRIRAQIRLVKKNIHNTEMVDKRKTETKTSKSISSTHNTSTYTSNAHREETDTIHEGANTTKPYETKARPKRPAQISKGGRVSDEDVPQKSPYGRSQSPKSLGKFRRNEEVTTTTTAYTKPQNGRSESPKLPTKTSPERHHSPETKTPHGLVKEVRRTSGSSTQKEYVRSEEADYSEKRFNRSRLVDMSSERFVKDQSTERSYSPESKSPIRDNRRQSPDSKSKFVSSPRTKSPDGIKPSVQRTTSPQGRTPKQRDDAYTISKVTTIKTTRSPERKSSKPTADEHAPIWADRKNLLKSPSSTQRKLPASPTSRTIATKTTSSKSISQQRQTQNRSVQEDSITSSYGIGPTDENGLPLFGIKALKKKKPSQPCETTEEVTGYVIEEKYYADSKTKPKVERKEYIYSTNADELEEIKKSVEQSRKSSKNDVDVIRKFEKIGKDYVLEKPEAIMPDNEEYSTASSKYVRRGSVKELSEKFIRKESTQSTTEKSGGYPKAGLILRTSRGPSTEPGDGYETTTEKYTTTTSSGHGFRPIDGEYDDDEYDVQLRQKQSRRLFTEHDDNESEQSHMSTRTSTKSTRSFLNSSDETKTVTSVDDALERMRNADYVVEAGDTAEDREARALLNKFLGASVIMKGVECVLPASKQTTTTTITKTSYADDDDDSDLLRNKAVKTNRITKTTKSGSSSTPVTRTTCDIEEIWDEEILKELLEQATTYEERRKIRARLRDLMAEREEQQATSTTEKTETKEKDGAVVTTTTKVTTRTVSGSGNSAAKPASPFAKFRQLDKQNLQQSPKSPSTPTTPGATASPSGSARIFHFTDPALNARAATVKEQLLQWCQSKTQEYENVKITNFSASWSDGLAFCALIHHFLPDAFDYSTLTPKSRRHNFELAFTVADEKAGIAPLLDVEDMVEMSRPDWKCVFIYVQSIYRRFRNCQ